MRFAPALLLCALPALGQDAPVRAPSVYESFFLTVSQLSKVEPEKLTAPTLRDSIGLTASQMQALEGIAAECAAKTLALGDEGARAVFEGRMRAIESNGDPEWLTRQMKSLDERAARAVAQSVEKLKAALDEAAFVRFENYVRSDWIHRCFVGPCFEGKPPQARR